MFFLTLTLCDKNYKLFVCECDPFSLKIGTQLTIFCSGSENCHFTLLQSYFSHICIEINCLPCKIPFSNWTMQKLLHVTRKLKKKKTKTQNIFKQLPCHVDFNFYWDKSLKQKTICMVLISKWSNNAAIRWNVCCKKQPQSSNDRRVGLSRLLQGLISGMTALSYKNYFR